ncbi:MAG: hypothetical protein V4606_02890 [Patescibacteria group bacterium]
MHITPTMMQEISQVLQIDTLSEAEQNALNERVGNEVLENTLLLYLNGLNEWEQSSFQQWITAHAGDADMMADLLLLYPDFGKILSQQIILLAQKSQ